MPLAKMNLFQQLARCWDELHPYNAAQAMRLAIPVAPATAQEAWNSTLQDLGLGHVEVHGRCYRHLPGASDVSMLAPGADPGPFISEQLNIRFPNGQTPFRPFLQTAGSGETLAGLVYHHWIADSVSVRILMREWFIRMTHQGQPRRHPIPLLCDESLYAGEPNQRSPILNLVRLTHQLKGARRMPPACARDLTVAHRVLRLPDGAVQRLRLAAHELDVKLGDLLLCSIAEVCHRHLPAAHPHRPGLALGTIRDMRPIQPSDDPDAFGAALTMASVFCRADLLADRPALLEQIARQTAAHRGRRLAASHRLDMRVALFIARLLRRNRALEFFRKRMPLLAGLSNVDLSQTWVAQHPQTILEFYRISPAGPALPLVVTPTTLNERFNISLTWRTSAISQTQVEAIAADLAASLQSWQAARELVYESAA